MSRGPLRQNERGVGLVELMIALVVTSMVIVATYKTFFGSQHEALRVTRVVERRQNSRASIQLLERELRMAGSGWGRDTINGKLGATNITLYGIQRGYGGSLTGNDTIGILGGWDTKTALRAGKASPGATIRCQSTAGFAVNDFIVVTNEKRAHLFRATAVSSSPADISVSTSSNYNTSGSLTGWPVGGYVTGDKVYRVSWVSYKMDTTSFKKRALMRWQAGSAAQVVGYDVSNFRVSYALQNGTVKRNPTVAEIQMIDKIVPVVTTLAPGVNNSVAIVDSAWTEVRPRTF
ncbi:MAG TPA: prepilin-type N-terminal cleavage/methylation domain-containing protein [Candidatus Limnocylindria bacterium]|nr:prepilin-type N-terminal cleavage/methylation domain-containing protein [Candidatus Limnocylindria bacterium]